MFILLLTLIFLRPFISSLAFPYANFIHSLIFGSALITWLLFNLKAHAKLDFIKYPLLFFIFSLALSFSFSSDRALSAAELYKYITPVLILFFGGSLSPEERSKVLSTIVKAGLLVSVLALYQYFFGFRHTLSYMAKENITDPFALDYLSRARVFFPFITPNILAGYLIVIIPLAFAKKELYWTILPLSLALLLTKSMGAFMSLFLALNIYFYLHKGLGRRQLLVLVAVASGITLFLIIRSSGSGEHLRPGFSGVMRFNYWKETWGVIKESVLLGAGPGNFSLIYSRYAHNSYLQVWAEMGLLGLLSLLLLVGGILKKALNSISTGLDRKMQAALIASASAFLIHNLLDFTFFLPEASFIWWVILSLSL